MLWLLAVVLAILGVLALLQGQLIVGLLLLVVATLVGPGGHSVGRGSPTI